MDNLESDINKHLFWNEHTKCWHCHCIINNDNANEDDRGNLICPVCGEEL